MLSIEIKGIKLSHLLVCAIIAIVASALGKVPGGMIGGFAITMIFGFLFDWLGEKTPIINTYLGGGPIFCIFLSAAIVYYAQFLVNGEPLPGSEQILNIKKVVDSFVGGKGSNFLDFYIAALICGSILGMDGKLLIKAGVRFAVPLLGGLLVASLMAAIVGFVSAYGWNKAVAFVCYPIMGGGLGAGVIPMAEILQKATLMDSKVILSMLIPPMAIANVMAIISGGLLDRLGKKYPSLTGNGRLIVSKNDQDYSSGKNIEISMRTLGTGLLISCTFMVLGHVLNGVITSLHYYALMIVSVALVKVINIIPEQIQDSCAAWFRFVATYLTAPLLIGVGVTYTNLGEVINAFNLQTFILVTSVVIGAIIGAGLGGLLVGFYFIESAIAAGLCMANMGGTGDVAVLSASKRMELMPFAQISSRLGGALVLIVVSLTIGFLA